MSELANQIKVSSRKIKKDVKKDKKTDKKSKSRTKKNMKALEMDEYDKKKMAAE